MKRDKRLLYASIADPVVLKTAHTMARKGKRDYKSVIKFEEDLDVNLQMISQSILKEIYKTSNYNNKVIDDKGKLRIISKLPYNPDRVVQWSIMLQMWSMFMDDFSPHSHAAIPNKGTHSALKEIRSILYTNSASTQYCLKLDIYHYFQSINQDILYDMICDMTKDIKLQKINKELIYSYPYGVPIGNYTSQYYANKYLSKFDYWLLSKNIIFVRYMDDIVIFGETIEHLRQLYYDIEWYLKSILCLDIKSNYQIYSISSRGIDFVGYRIWHNRVLLRKSIFNNLRKKSYSLQRKLQKHLTITNNDISSINSYYGIITHCTPKCKIYLYETYFKPIYDKATDIKPKSVDKLIYGKS